MMSDEEEFFSGEEEEVIVEEGEEEAAQEEEEEIFASPRPDEPVRSQDEEGESAPEAKEVAKDEPEKVAEAEPEEVVEEEEPEEVVEEEEEQEEVVEEEVEEVAEGEAEEEPEAEPEPEPPTEEPTIQEEKEPTPPPEEEAPVEDTYVSGTNTPLPKDIAAHFDEWKSQRVTEERKLKELKERQKIRKEKMAEQERVLAERRKLEEEQRRQELEEKKQRDHEEKMRRLAEHEKRKFAMLQASKEKYSTARNFAISKKISCAQDLKEESAESKFNKSKEEIAEMKRVALSLRVQPLQFDNMNKDSLKKLVKETWEKLVQLETNRYDLEEREKRQNYDFKELKERQKQQLRVKAMKLGIDPEEMTGKYPPKIRLVSKFERKLDVLTYSDKKSLFDGGFEKLHYQQKEGEWQQRYKDQLQKIVPKQKEIIEDDDIDPYVVALGTQARKFSGVPIEDVEDEVSSKPENEEVAEADIEAEPEQNNTEEEESPEQEPEREPESSERDREESVEVEVAESEEEVIEEEVEEEDE